MNNECPDCGATHDAGEGRGAPELEMLGPAALYKHDHPPVRNINEEFSKRQSLGQRVADKVAAIIGSWPFIITQSCFLAAWLAANTYLIYMVSTHPGFLKAWDPYPFILLNLVLSFQAAYTGPVVMMSQNRQSEKDRLAAEHDFEINTKAELEIQVVMEQATRQDGLILQALARLEELHNKDMVGVLGSIDRILARLEANDKRMEELMSRIGDKQ